MSSTLAGNLTITGSVANIIVAERAKPEVHFGFREYFRRGGISHDPREHTDDEQLISGAKVLLNVVLHRLGVA